MGKVSKVKEIMMNLDLDVISASERIGEEESILYIRTSEQPTVSACITGETDSLLTGLFTLCESTENAFELFLEFVDRYAEYKNIDILELLSSSVVEGEGEV